MIKIRMSAIEAVADNRAPGYVEAVIAAASGHDDTHVWMTDEAYQDIRERFALPPPSFSQKLRNFAQASVKHIAQGMPMATEEQVQARFAICQTCEFLKAGACTKCGCPVVREKKFISKLSWADSSCPIGKWGPVGNEQ